MRSARVIPILSLAAALLAVVLVVGVRTYMGRPAQDRLLAPERVGIAELRPPLPPPSFLACPPGYCAAGAGIASPIFALPWQRLRDDWTAMIADQPRVVRIDAELQGQRLTYIQHSLLFRFPDIVTVEVVPLGPDSSGIALYSRSRYGRRACGSGGSRNETWLSLLETLANPRPLH